MSVQDQQAQLLLNARRLRAGMLLTIVGAAIGAIGSTIAGLELAAATRKWMAESGYPPSELARLKMRQALSASQAATHAAVEAWQHGNGRVGAGIVGTQPGQ